jgi:membrane-associated phospholipid phosphatase
MIGTLLAYIERWKKISCIYAFNTIFMSVIIVYTGDHYLEDAIASIVLVLGIFAVSLAIFRKLGWIKKDEDGSYRSTSRKE